MAPLPLATWNVLHRVHAENWGEAAGPGFLPEAQRLERIAGVVLERLAQRGGVVCLQEASGDLLARLRAGLPPQAALFSHLYPRTPRLRGVGPCPLADPSEHLVVLVSGEASRGEGRTFPSDPGKGWLGVELGALMLVCTHVSFGEKGVAQLEALAAVARSAPGPLVVAGDFNCAREPALARLRPDAWADVSGQALRTRPDSGGGHDIDHVFGFRCALGAAGVRDSSGLSDHNLVEVEVDVEAGRR